MSVNLLLALLFVTLTLSVWTLLRFGLLGYGRYQTEFTARAEDSFEQLFLFFDTRKIFFINLGLLLVLPMAVYLVSGSLFYVALVLIAILCCPNTCLCCSKRGAARPSMPSYPTRWPRLRPPCAPAPPF